MNHRKCGYHSFSVIMASQNYDAALSDVAKIWLVTVTMQILTREQWMRTFRDDNERSQREHIRHPIDIPIHIQSQSPLGALGVRMNNVSIGGLAFRTQHYIEPGHMIKITIDAVRPIFQVKAAVQWCHQVDQEFEIGVQFSDLEDAFQMRMVEQVCHIEHYRQQVWREEKRHLSGEAAAAEWIEKYAHQFPKLDLPP